MKRVATIGVYGWTVEDWLEALREADAALIVDIRQRRGVRGREYAWANAQRLETALEQAAIGYRHELTLAPTTEIRQVQYDEDRRQGVGKRSRQVASPEYVARYRREILDRADLDELVASLPDDGASVLLCVEHDAELCHRSLVAARLAEQYGLEVRHL
ncbi:MAG TPA: DUF488 domain-containing protein [Gaiellaceae bacterium]